jgi:effector-binding domain-containing protein
MLTKWMNQDRFPVANKQSEAEVVAYIKFEGLNDIAKNIWKLRDWLNSNDLHPAGSPSCLMQLPESTSPLDARTVPCEVQWRIAEAPHSTANGIGLKMVEPQQVFATFHLGDTTSTELSLHFLQQAAAAEGYRVTGAAREIYLFDFAQPKSRWITEIQIFVDKI